VNSPEDKTPDFEEFNAAGDAAPEQQPDESLEPEGAGPESAPADAEPGFSFTTADTPAEPLEPLAGLDAPGEEAPAEPGPEAIADAHLSEEAAEDAAGEPALEETAELAAAEPGAPAGLPDFLSETAEGEEGAETAGEEKEAEEKAEEEKEPKESLLAKLAQANPYTVLLGIALAALTLGVLCLLLELKSYDFDWKAEGARGRAARPAIYEAPSSTTAAAWPDWVQLSDNA